MTETAGQTVIARDAIAGLAGRLAEEERNPDDLVAEALRAEDGESALAVTLAAHVAERPCDVRGVADLLVRTDYLDDIPLLVAATRGDRIEALLDAAERGGVDWERQALFLYLATAIAEGPPPDRLVTGLRRLARRDLRDHEGIYIGLAAKKLGHPDLDAVARSWIALADNPELTADAEHLLAPLRRPLLETLPEEAPPRTVTGFTVRRAAKKVGRNEPCPCGSGKKYKKCCERRDRERLADPSPVPGVTMQEYLARPHDFLSPTELGRLRAHELAGLPLADLPTAHLETVVRTLTLDWAWTDAERALAELARREDAAYPLEDYRLLLVGEAWRGREKELARRHLDQLTGEHDPEEVAVLRELLEPGPATLSRVEEMAARGLREEPWRISELAMNLLPEYPALGVLVGRGAMAPEQTDDVLFLLQEIEDARDRLQLPPGDAAGEVAHALFGAEEEARGDGEDSEELRARLEKANRRADALERELQLKQEKLETEARQKEAAAAEAPERDSEREAETAAEAELLRAKVSHLKSLISDSKEERRRLQREIEELSRDPGPSTEAPPARPAPPPPEEAPPEPEEPPSFRRPLVPELSSRAREAIAEADPKLARRAMQTTFDLALGQRRAAAQVKRLERVGDLWSARVGIHHRLLFRFDERNGSLEVVDLIDREELKTRLKHLS